MDEKEYSSTVLKRQRDDWIVDDGKSFLNYFKAFNIVFHIILKRLYKD